MKRIAAILLLALLAVGANKYVPFRQQPVPPDNAICQGGGTIVHVADDVQTAINTAGTNGTLCFQQGIYRVGLGVTGRNPITPISGQTYNCAGTAGSCVLDGSRVVTGWQPFGTVYVAVGYLPGVPLSGFGCESINPLCNHAEDVFVDGQRLFPVASVAALTTGTFYNNYSANLIFLYDNPTGHTVEQAYNNGLIWTQHFSGGAWVYPAINNVTINGLGFQKTANGANFGAVQSRGTSGWVVKNVFAQFNHGAGLSIGNNSSITYSTLNNNGQLCINQSQLDTQLVDHVTCNYNNQARYVGNDTSGGLKGSLSQNVTITNSNFIGNYGIGIWCDTACWKTTITNNYVKDNWYSGIVYEMSTQGDIEYNTVIHSTNGHPQPTVFFYVWGDLTCSVCDNTVIANNTVTTMANGLGVLMQARTTQCVYNPPYPLGTPPGTLYPDSTPLCYTNIIPIGSHTVVNVDVHDNTVTSDASTGGGVAVMAGFNSDMIVNYPATAPLMFTSQNIHFHDNTYCMPNAGGLWFTWSYDTVINATDWVATGNDTTSTFNVAGVSC